MSGTVTRNIVVYFDETSWSKWGISWTASLNLLARFQGNVIVIDFGLSNKTLKFFEKLNYTIIPREKKYDLYELDFFHTVSNYAYKNQGFYATWNNNCYFQNNIDEIFNLSNNKLLCCCGHEPQMSFNPSIDMFGYKNNVAKNINKLHDILKKVSKIYKKPICNNFFAGPSDVWSIFNGFLQVYLNTGFLQPKQQVCHAAINLFVYECDFLVSVLDETWCQPIVEELEWNNGFYRNGNKVNVIYHDDQYDFSFRNRFSKLHNEWLSSYKGYFLKPKFIKK